MKDHLNDKQFGEPDGYLDHIGGHGKAHKSVRCYQTHPPVPLGGGVFIGGSCSDPVTNKADIYIGFDYSMKATRRMPWDNPPVAFLYEIADMNAPSDSKSFIKLIDWAVEQLAAGKTLHAGCIGGHGRTGTFLAALWSVIKNEKDCIEPMRAAYCHKAVESAVQMSFLNKHFGVKVAKGAKEGQFHGGQMSIGHSSWNNPSHGNVHHLPAKTGGKEWKSSKQPQGAAFAGATMVYNPIRSQVCVFGSVL